MRKPVWMLFLVLVLFSWGCTIQVGDVPTPLPGVPKVGGKDKTGTVVTPPVQRRTPPPKPPVNPPPPISTISYCLPRIPQLTWIPDLFEGIEIPSQCSLQSRSVEHSSYKSQLKREKNRWILTRSTQQGQTYTQTVVVEDANGRPVERKDFDTEGRVTSHRIVTFDAQGKVTSFRQLQFYKGQKRWEKTTTLRWEKSRLVERTEVTEPLNRDKITLRFRWTYNAKGAMTSASFLPNGSTSAEWLYRWFYTTTGLPIKMEGLYKGQMHTLQNWEWSSKGVLRKRVMEFRSAQQRRVEGLFVWPGTTAEKTSADGSCTPLESQWGSGYKEQAYTLGQASNKTRGKILLSSPTAFRNFSGWSGDAASNMRYGQVYALMFFFQQHTLFQQYNPQWMEREQTRYNLPGYGHYGFREPVPLFARFGKDEGLRLEVEYDEKGRMLREKAWRSTLRKDKPAVVVSKTNLIFARERTRKADRLTLDRLEILAGEKKRYIRSLRFQYDDAGGLKRRELWHDDRLLEFQNWRYDSRGKVSFVSFGAQSQKEEYAIQSWEQHQSPKGRLSFVAPTVQVSVTLSSDAKGRLLRETLEWSGANDLGRKEVVYTYTTTRQRQMTTTSIRNQTSRLEKVFDTKGNLLEENNDYNNDGVWERKLKRSYNQHNALLSLEVVSLSRGSTSRQKTSFQYVCQ